MHTRKTVTYSNLEYVISYILGAYLYYCKLLSIAVSCDTLTGSKAEVQTVFHDGALSLHTRSLKYGKVTWHHV